MPTPVFFDEDAPFDPDHLKVAESPRHRRACDVIGLAAVDLLGPDHDVFRDMNWYPTDGGNAMAPDVMVVPAGVVGAQPDVNGKRPASYRQDVNGGPPPTVSIEVPSDSDTVFTLMAKVERCRRLGVMVYIVAMEGAPSVMRYAPAVAAPEPWDGLPIDELGGLRIHLVDDDDPTGDDHDRPRAVMVELPDGTRARTDHELMTARSRRAEAAAAEAEAAVAQAQAELQTLREQLRRRNIELD